MKELMVRGIICLKDECNIEYRVCNIDYVEYEDGTYKYLFYPFYNVIDLLKTPRYQGIPGLNLDKRQECYIRNNMTPVFISERTPGPNRVDLADLLKSCHMKSLNRLEWLIRTNLQYFGDYFYVIRNDEKNDDTIVVDSMFDLINRYDSIIKKLLEIICYGRYLKSKEITIDDTNRKSYYDLLMPIYKKQYESKMKKIKKGISKAKEKKVYKGRKPINVEYLKLCKLAKEYKAKEKTLDEVLDILKISKSTFFRKLKEINVDIDSTDKNNKKR